MEKRINLELRNRDCTKVKEIDLAGVKCGGEIDFGSLEFTSLEVLTISDAFLTSLKNFPALPNLKRLDLCNNRLSKGLEELKVCPNLKYLLLTGNRFKNTNLDVLQPLALLPNLTHLELGGFYPEDKVECQEIRNKIFSLIPSLQYLESEDINGKPDKDLEDDEDDDDEDDDESDNDDLDDDDDLVVNGDDENTDDESDSDEEEERSYVNGDMNGVVPEYADQSSDDAEDEDDEEEDDDRSNHPPVRGKKRKFEDDGLP